MNLFITGTDTNVGKTIISSWICMHSTACYWKPIQTGDDSDGSVIHKLSPKTTIIEESYKLKAPLSPYDAANLEGKKINTMNLKKEVKNCVIEGAGGCLVPIAENFHMLDLAKANDASVLLVSNSRLGMINQILLSVEAIRIRNIPILGIIINGHVEKQLINTIEKFSNLSIIHTMRFHENLHHGLLHTILPIEISEVFK